MSAHICTNIYMHIHRWDVQTYIDTYIHDYITTYIPYIHTSHTYIHNYLLCSSVDRSDGNNAIRRFAGDLVGRHPNPTLNSRFAASLGDVTRCMYYVNMMHVCMYVYVCTACMCMYICMFVLHCMHVCMYICICVYVLRKFDS